MESKVDDFSTLKLCHAKTDRKRAGIWIYEVLLLHVLQRAGIWIYVVLLLHVLRDKSATLCTCCKKAGIWVYEVL
jgi:hypothetical protein